MSRIVELDVRPYLRKKHEPFQIIMDTVKTLSKEDTFVLHATFKPTPLLGLLKTKGFNSKVEQLDSEHWVVTFKHKSQERESDDEQELASEEDAILPSPERSVQTYELDNRGLEPPQPMIRTLSKLQNVHSGDKVIIHNDRVPMFLIEELNTLGYAYTVEDQEDGSAKVAITKAKTKT
ncbi:MAG: DUF2249 domain-containing protein [Paenibacillaceae bacterium]